MGSMDSADSRIGERIKQLLKSRQLTMRKLAELCGMDVATVSRIANGKQQPRLKHLRLFAEHLNVPLDKLVEAADVAEGEDAPVPDGRAEAEETARPGILESLDAIRALLAESRLFDPDATTSRIEQELQKYELYARTEEGHRMICQDFGAKVSQVGGVGPFIEQLKRMHERYCDEETPDRDRSVLGSALLYFILSADIIPDYLFPVGYLDDAIAVHLVLDRLNRNGFSA